MAKNTEPSPELVPISINTLAQWATPAFDIYLQQDKRFVLYSSKHLPLTTQQLSVLIDDGIQIIYIPKEQTGEYRTYMQNNLAMFAQSPAIPLEEKAKLIYSTASDIMQDLFDNPSSPETVVKTKSVSHIILDQIYSDPRALVSLMKVSSYDYYTYTHCINVSVYSLGIARAIKLDRESMKVLGEGSILHDIGKSRIDIEIVNKPGPLSDEEFTQMKHHCNLGEEILSQMGERDSRLLQIVSQHHEKLNGTGYPRGLKDDEISMFAQIVTIADVFDALTTRRSYKEALSSFQAFRIMKNKMDGHFNTKILDSFILAMQG